MALITEDTATLLKSGARSIVLYLTWTGYEGRVNGV